MDEKKNLTIKDWNADDRPREKMLAKGISTLSDAELLAILISTGTQNQSALDLARAVLSSVGNNLHALGKCSVADLTKIPGIGKAKAVTIMAALELGRRRRETDRDQSLVKNSGDAFEILQPLIGELQHEEFWVLFLNRGGYVIDKLCVSQGGVSGTLVDVRIIMKLAIERLASSLILAHNHPSGSLAVSREDENLTRRVKEAAKVFDIQLVDHIIISDRKFVSLADLGKV